MKESLTTIYREIISGLRDAIAPARCMGCLREGFWLCTECALSIAPLTPTCALCNKPSPQSLTCSRCRTKTELAGVVSVGRYSSPWLRRGIHWFKFKGVRELAHIFAHLLAPRLTVIAPIRQLQKEAVLVPIPLHKRRLRDRGFNQSLNLALALTHLTDIPTYDVLIRTRATFTQTKLPDELRAGNVRDAFVIRTQPPLNKRFVILVDDVTTSGSTLSAAASLFPPDEYRTWGATLARG